MFDARLSPEQADALRCQNVALAEQEAEAAGARGAMGMGGAPAVRFPTG
jgi:hypothetical protein